MTAQEIETVIGEVKETDEGKIIENLKENAKEEELTIVTNTMIETLLGEYARK